MKTRQIQIITICMLLCLTVLCIPASYSKYATNFGYTINVKMTPEKAPDKTLWVYPGESTNELTIPANGYYAIIAKGGDGADGIYRNKSHDFFERKGGTGGTVMGIFKLNEDDILYLYPGTDGTRPTSGDPASKGSGGINNSAIASGGSGNDSAGGLWAADWLSSVVASGGGGAGSVVFLNGNKNANVILIAGGGGGAGSCDMESTVNGISQIFISNNGGNGGSVFNTSISPITATTAPNGYVYPGTDGYGGEQSSEKNTSDNSNGTGASKTGYNVAGTGGKTSRVWYIIDYVPKGEGGSGLTFDNFGTGGSSDKYGGGGGGGYCGGGAGTGTSIYVGAGGGGGGSSFVASTVNGISVTIDSSRCSSIIEKVSSKLPAQKSTTTETITYQEIVWKGIIPKTQKYTLSKTVFTDNGDGYVVVEYLGKTLN